jgi:hypothetical protein
MNIIGFDEVVDVLASVADDAGTLVHGAKRVAHRTARRAQQVAIAVSATLAALCTDGMPTTLPRGELPPVVVLGTCAVPHAPPRTARLDPKAAFAASMQRLRERGINADVVVARARENLSRWKATPARWDNETDIGEV